MIRTFFTGCAMALALISGAGPAALAANDKTMREPELDIVGFNGRGYFFGIEQFGLRPHTGIPYSEIRIYDLRKDKEIDRSPFVYDETAKIPEGHTIEDAIDRARRAVYLDARRVIKYLMLVPRGRTIVPQDGKPAKALQISAPGLSGLLTLETFPLEAPHCKGIRTVGFVLRLADGKGVTEVHRDKAMPKGRGCPVDYDIRQASVYLPHPEADALAVVIGARQGGRDKGDIHYTVVGHFYDHRKK